MFKRFDLILVLIISLTQAGNVIAYRKPEGNRMKIVFAFNNFSFSYFIA